MVDFLIIGPCNVIVYVNCFPLIKDQKMKLGYNRVIDFNGGNSSSMWFTTFDVKERGYLKLKEYKEGNYKKFDNYNAINIDRTEDIPDYDGVMGVPITFLEKWNPGQFELIGLLNNMCYMDEKGLRSSEGLNMTSVDGQLKYIRILIKKK